MRTIAKAYRELQPGDRILLPTNIVRTFSRGGPNGMVNRNDEPLWSIYYAEGHTPEWSAGNSGLPYSLCAVVVEDEEAQA
jgi:hypothetical protein